MATKYSQIPIGTIFNAKGTNFRKLDDLYYEDLNTGFQEVWSPMFDANINTPSVEPVADKDNTKDKFLVDQQTRIVKPNPNYKECDGAAEKVFAEMWGSGEYNCDPDDYNYMAMVSVQAVGAMKAMGEIVDVDGEVVIMFPVIEDILKKAYAAQSAAVSTKKSVKRAPATKKVPAKTVKKAKRK